MIISSRKQSPKIIVNMFGYKLAILLIVLIAIPLIFIKSIWFDRPVVVQKVVHVDNLHGKVTGKSMVGNLYTIDCGAYGKFLVTKEQYYSINVGDYIPSYLKGRGQ